MEEGGRRNAPKLPNNRASHVPEGANEEKTLPCKPKKEGHLRGREKKKKRGEF